MAASLRFLDEHRIVVEPACGAALAAFDTATPALVAASRIAVIVCGGVTATVEHLHALNSQGRETERGGEGRLRDAAPHVRRRGRRPDVTQLARRAPDDTGAAASMVVTGEGAGALSAGVVETGAGTGA